VLWDTAAARAGRDPLLLQKEAGVRRRLVQFGLRDPDAFAYHDEPVYRDGVLAGRVSSAAYGHTLGRTVALGYVTAPAPGTPASWYTAGEYEIEIACERVPADASLRPRYDPKSERPRG
jgi:4-methylaminobutanoate oxidase (formaldehyde-forming)